MLTEKQLTDFAEDFLMDIFGVYLTEPVTINGRLKSTFGHFKYNPQTGKQGIEMSKEFLSLNPDEKVLDVLKHECIHYGLYVQGKPHSDSSYEFKRTCRQLDVGLSGEGHFIAERVVYECPKCSARAHRANKLSKNRHYQCSRCKTRMENKGKQVITV